MPKERTPDLVLDARATLGECPVWSAAEGALYWLDCAAPALHRLDPGTGKDKAWPLPVRAGSFVLTADGRDALVALESGLWTLRLADGTLTPWFDPERDKPDNRFNDGKCDPAGRFWVGSMPKNYKDPTGTLWRVAPDGDCEAMRGGIRVSNGPAWSADGKIFYFSDSVLDTTFAFDFDAAEGTIAKERALIGPKAAPGYPDGAAADADGGLWMARWEGGCVARFTPDGRLDRTVPLPVDRVTSVAFGGGDLKTLYITTGAIGMSEAEKKAQPHSGGLFAFEPGVAGAPVASFGAPL